MRVALINPPQSYLVEPSRNRPLGLMYVHSAARKACPWAWVEIVETAALHPENIVPHLAAGQYDVCAWTATTLDYFTVRKLAQEVLGRTGAIQVIGGPHATVAEYIDPCFRVVFKGEGEQTFPKFLADYQRGEALSVYDAPRIERLDGLHFPYRGGATQGRIMRGGEEKSATIMGSRGCAHDCAFCASKCLWPGPVRFRSAESIAREVEVVRDRGGITDFAFYDENLTLSTSHLKTVCAAVKRLRIHWRAQARTDCVDRQKLEIMRDAGCREIDFGIESFDDRVLRFLVKGTTAKQNERAVELAKAAGIPARLFLMISTPGETFETTVERNKAALLHLQGAFDTVNLYTFMPLPGTPISREPEKYGVRIVSRDWDRYNRHQYRREDGEVTDAAWSPIEIGAMSREQQTENIVAMHEFVNGLSEVNTGVLA